MRLKSGISAVYMARTSWKLGRDDLVHGGVSKRSIVLTSLGSYPEALNAVVVDCELSFLEADPLLSLRLLFCCAEGLLPGLTGARSTLGSHE